MWALVLSNEQHFMGGDAHMRLREISSLFRRLIRAGAKDHEFELLQVKASIAPQAEQWPKPDFSKVSLAGDKPHMEVGDPHWDALRDTRGNRFCLAHVFTEKSLALHRKKRHAANA